MKNSALATPIALLAVALVLSQSSCMHDEGGNAGTRIGVYDSRAVAVAFSGSPAHEKQLSEHSAALKTAEEAGDTAEVAKLEAEAEARQAKVNAQAFSTAPVDEILALIADSLIEVQKTAGVTALVSRWDEAELKKYDRAEKVDLTMQLVDALHPNERQRESAIEIQKHKPMSLEKAQRLRN